MIISQWEEIIIGVNVRDVDMAGDIAQMVVPYGIYIEDYSNLEAETMEVAHIDLIDEKLLAKDRTIAFIHIYVSPEQSTLDILTFLSERYSDELIANDISVKNCAEEDWINNWKKYFKPMEVGEKLLVRPTWEDEYDAKGRTVLHLEPGLAFGTGTHETTRLCMELIEKHINNGDTVLDMGCGSGILSVAALLLGANTAIGVDIDQLAVKTAIENAKINSVDDRFTGICGNLTEKVSGKFNVVVANIVADTVILMSDNAPQFMYEDSIFIMSGIIDTREADVLTAISEKFVVIERKEEKGWIALAAKLK